VRNAVLMGYPVVASIKSILPLVDEFVVGVGQSDDETLNLIRSINDPKIKIFESFWDQTKTKGGLILSEKTNEALSRCQNDWCFYLQADEVVHEADLPVIRVAVQKHDQDLRVEGLLFQYIHFYGSYGIIATARNWYRNEIRLVRKSSNIQSFNDAQGFRVDGRKPRVKKSGARVFHYGWVKPPAQMGQKNKLLSRWWHGEKMEKSFDSFQYSHFYGLRPFKGSHPELMKKDVTTQTWSFQPRKTWSDWTLKEFNYLASDLFESVFKFRIGEYKNYKLLKD